MPSVIVPVGHDLGPSYPIVAKPDKSAPPDYCDVRFRQNSLGLIPAEYVVWSAAFADAKRAASFDMGREQLIDNIPRKARSSIDVDGILDELLKRELLLEYDPEEALSEEVARRLQLYPSGVGLGNEASDPDWFHIGTRGDKLVKVTGTVYTLWAYSSLQASIWDTCVKAYEGNEQAIADGEDIDAMPSSAPIQALSLNIPLLVSSGCAFLDWVS